jgi:TRAP-type C4-dicarboxylate transport system permease large subunit
VEPITIGFLGILGLSLMLVSGMRIAFATALCGIVGLWVLKGYKPAMGFAGLLPHAELVHYTLLVIPLFVLMGFFAFHAGITRDLFVAARAWFGHLPGGLAIATVFGSAGFAAACGASIASTAVIGRVALPELKRYGYDDKVAAGAVAAGGTMATMIPPSVLMVIYGFIADESIGELLLAGFLPGMLEAITYSTMLMLRFKINPRLGPPIRGITWGERIGSLKGTWGIIVLVLLVMGGIYTGVSTPTESAGVGALGAFMLALHKHFRDSYAEIRKNPGVGPLSAIVPTMRNIQWGNFKDAFLDTGRTTAMIFAIIVGVLIFVRFLAFTGMPGAVAEFIVALEVNRYIVLIGVLGLYIVLGMFLDPMGILLLTVPIVLPSIRELGFNPIVFGILLVRVIEIGLITPPVGLNVFVLRGVAPDIKMGDIFRGCGWFVLVDLFNVAILIVFPQIILFIPSTMRAAG